MCMRKNINLTWFEYVKQQQNDQMFRIELIYS